MIQSYQKILKMESAAKFEQNKIELEKISKILYPEKEFVINKLIAYLKNELNIEYFKCKIVDIDNNIAYIIVKKDSKIFNENIKGKDFVNFNAEELLDSRMFDNKDEVIIMDLNMENNILDLGYICNSLNYNFLPYSDVIKEKLSTFVEYLINRGISET